MRITAIMLSTFPFFEKNLEPTFQKKELLA